MTRFLFVVLLAAVISPPPALGAVATELDRIIAVVDDDVIMESELDEQMNRVRAALRQQGTQMPPTAVLERQVMERLVLEKIQLQIADRSGIEVEDAALDRAVSDIAERNKLSIDQFKEILASEGYEFDRFREQIRQEILIAKVRREEVDKRISVSDSEIDNFLRNEEGGEDTLEYHLNHILIAVPSGSSDEEIRAARDKAEQTLARLESGEDFESVAISVSDGQQALEGGDLGWRKGGEIPSLFADPVSNMKVGDVSSIITSPSGFHIVKLVDKRAGDKIMVEQFRTRHILIKPNELVSPEQALNRIRQLKLRLDGGADFANLAKTNSDDRGSALRGGDLGWVSRGEMVPEFEEVMTAMPVGEISQPFKSEFGFHILQVTETRQYDGTEEVRRNRARQAIRQQKIEERHQSWLRRLRDEAYVEYREAE
ncbi:MAG: peptidylprolyl isomerase [Gammaproteobacteria bacterium]|nr:peptidylprolyl isomerase [Gammaproteobacteria bacterium]